ncbi:OsmC family protein [Flavisolibacter sp. BT320]|nr:OsmC family protein [Flavisolibacter longurius]
MAKILLERKKGAFGFDVKDELGHLLQTDSSRENGGDDYGFRPMQLLLAALGSCSAIDMVAILSKQRQEISDMVIEIEGEREKDVIPSLWKTISVVYNLKGNIDAEKAEKAATLSMEKYCSVAETLRRGGTAITWKVNVETTLTITE